MSSPSSIRVGGVEFGAVADLSRAGVGAKEGLETRDGRNGASGSLFGRFFRTSRQQRGKVEERPSSNRVAEAPAEFLPIPRPLEPCEVDEPVISPRPEASGQEESRSLREHLRAAETHKGLSPTSPIASFENFVLESLTKKHRRRPLVDLASTVEAIRREGSSVSPQDGRDITSSSEHREGLRGLDCGESSAELEQGELTSRLQSVPSEERAESRGQTLALTGSDWNDDAQEAPPRTPSADERFKFGEGATSFKLPELPELRSSQALQGLESELQKTSSSGRGLSGAHEGQESPLEENLLMSGQESEGDGGRTAEDGAGLDSQREGLVGVGSPGSRDNESSESVGASHSSSSGAPLVDSKAEHDGRRDSRSVRSH